MWWTYILLFLFGVESKQQTISKLNNPTKIKANINTYQLSDDGKLNFVQIVNKYGFPCETHDVITEDGYILKLFHIPGDVNRAVFLVHGGATSADCWVSRGNISLAITLAKKEFDVWAIDLRGSRYSRRHRKFHPVRNMNQFYNFSIHEFGFYDLPASIDYILSVTQLPKINVIGYSLGSPAMYIMGAEKPQYNAKINILISLAPTVFARDMQGPIRFVLDELGPLTNFIDLDVEILNHDTFGSKLRKFCFQPYIYNLCYTILLNLMGREVDGLENNFLTTFLGHYPSGYSLKCIQHMLQWYNTDKIANYDHGVRRNLEIYGRSKPQEYDFGKITMPVALLVGQSDNIASIKSVARLKKVLPNVVYYKILQHNAFNHLSFAWAQHIPYTLYPTVFQLLR